MTDLRYVVYIVGAALLLSVGSITYLAASGATIPDVLQNIAVGSLTGMVGLLAPSPVQRRREGG